MTIINKVSEIDINKNDDYRMSDQEDMQRRFVDLQFKRSDLEKQLKRVNKVLYSYCREMEEHLLS